MMVLEKEREYSVVFVRYLNFYYCCRENSNPQKIIVICSQKREYLAARKYSITRYNSSYIK